MAKIFMMGDSTMRYNKITRYPQTGWGEMLNLFTKDFIIIENHAENGRSTKSFMDEKRFDCILERLAPGDFVICQFGHNDEKITDPLRYTTLDIYEKNLDYYAKKVEEKGGSIVFATPITRHKFEGGVQVETHQGYPSRMLEYCKKSNHICIDLNKETIALYNKIGEEKSKKFHMIFPPNTYPNYLEGKDDHSHLKPEGAIMICELFVKGLAKTDSLLNELMINLSDIDVIDEKMLVD